MRTTFRSFLIDLDADSPSKFDLLRKIAIVLKDRIVYLNSLRFFKIGKFEFKVTHREKNTHSSCDC